MLVRQCCARSPGPIVTVTESPAIGRTREAAVPDDQSGLGAPRVSAKPAGRRHQVRFTTVASPKWFVWLLSLYLLTAVPYLAWRVTVVNLGVWYGPVAYVAECFNTFMTALFLFVACRIELPVHRPMPAGRTVDALIPTYNEPLEILEPTVAAALSIRGIRHVLVLDDGNRGWVRQMTSRLGADYYPRSTNEHAKAGNMNNGLAHTDAEFVICFDADHVASPNFIERTLGYFEDPALAFVQSPQVFSNKESFLFRRRRNGWWSEQAMFYDVIQPAKNRFNAAFFVGTNAMLRRAALDDVGGFATGTATEDIHTSLRIHARGWKSIFVAEPLAHGLEAENLKEYFKQRRRWAAGSLGLLIRSADSPLRARGLSVGQRLNYVGATLSHLLGIQKMLYYVVPIVCVAQLVSPVTGSLLYLAPVMLLFAAFSTGLTAIFARGTYHFIYTEAYNLSHFLAHVAGLWGIVRVQKKFSVSRKVVAVEERTWLKAIWWILICVAVIAMTRAVWLSRSAHGALLSLLAVCIAFIAFNLVVLLAFFGHLLLYERRARRPKGLRGLGAAPRKRSRPRSQGPAFTARGGFALLQTPARLIGARASRRVGRLAAVGGRNGSSRRTAARGGVRSLNRGVPAGVLVSPLVSLNSQMPSSAYWRRHGENAQSPRARPSKRERLALAHLGGAASPLPAGLPRVDLVERRRLPRGGEPARRRLPGARALAGTAGLFVVSATLWAGHPAAITSPPSASTRPPSWLVPAILGTRLEAGPARQTTAIGSHVVFGGAGSRQNLLVQTGRETNRGTSAP